MLIGLFVDDVHLDSFGCISFSGIVSMCNAKCRMLTMCKMMYDCQLSLRQIPVNGEGYKRVNINKQ